MTKSLLITFFALSAFSASGQTSDTSFVSFWALIQKDIIAKDYKVLSTKTKYPLKAKGKLDFDTTDEYALKDFEKVFSKFLADDIFILNAEKNINKIMRYNFLKTYTLKAGDNKSKYVRIDDMVFNKINNKWWLTLIYDGHSKY